MRITIRCKHCGGANVVRDAAAAWDDAAQAWTLATVHDDGYCDDCGGEARLVERYLGPNGQDEGPVTPRDEYDEKSA